ncbi:MAG: hypothetical protein JXB26_06880 [Candidatus Aminicenantes bacterium]|nr:hypothetical protein [Candidatus Aminicenantes bacterium]
MEELKVPKKQKIVELLLSGKDQKVKDYIIYLSHSSRLMTGEETIEEFLKHSLPFFPVTDLETGQTVFINKNAIIFLREKEETQAKHMNILRVKLSNGYNERITRFIPLPEFQTRPVDAFNTEEEYLIFLHEGKKIYINKAHIQSVVPED